ncbi:hypothetical protein [Tunturiibacter lichenicola]|uniref:hypothetical protein n=1 Tax=Tunturiibacter lichenicola TaxID=2051959 RepID=UPI003D9AC991
MQKKLPWCEPGLFAVLLVFLRGVLGKRGAMGWFFVVNIVVDCGQNVEISDSFLRA